MCNTSWVVDSNESVIQDLSKKNVRLIPLSQVLHLNMLCKEKAVVYTYKYHSHKVVNIFLFTVSNLALVKPEKANAVENYLIQMARFGKLAGKVRNWPQMLKVLMLIFFHVPAVQWMDFLFCQISETGLIEILEKVSQQTEKKMTVKVSSTEMSPVYDSLSVTVYPSYIIYALYLSVQQTEGYGLRWWGWLLTLNGSPGMSQDIGRRYTLLGLW